MDETKLLAVLKQKEMSRHKLKYFFSFKAILFFFISYWFSGVYQERLLNTINEISSNDSLINYHNNIFVANVAGRYALFSFALAMFLLFTSLNCWLGSSERLALIALLEKDTAP